MTRPGYALVTGASRGLGRSFARTLAARKQNLVLVARSGEKLEALAHELRALQGIQVENISLDLSQPGAGQHLADDLTRRGLEIDLLVNNAGFGDQGRFLQLSLERQLQAINLQNATVVELTHRLLPAMIERKQGGIITVSSMAGFQPIPFASVYSATKAFLTTFSLALEAEMVRHGVSVVTVCPGRLRVAPEDVASGSERKRFPGGEQAHEVVVNEALRMLDRGGGLVIPGAINKFAAFAERFIPRSKVAKLIKNISKPPS
ncbi:MAG TPA: SDR family oxidoreductase [Pyrinomonadaceae bacterium]|jgi:short-subunit dehydrogenase|nr:SDR family oxidoreductase [Pyrinomonadaceae bacterium]